MCSYLCFHFITVYKITIVKLNSPLAQGNGGRPHLKPDFDDIQRADEGTGDHAGRWPGQGSFLRGKSRTGSAWIISHHSCSDHVLKAQLVHRREKHVTLMCMDDNFRGIKWNKTNNESIWLVVWMDDNYCRIQLNTTNNKRMQQK